MSVCVKSDAGPQQERNIATASRRVFVTGTGFIAAESFRQALDGSLKAPPIPPPEITAFETLAEASAWGFEALEFSLERELPQIKSFLDRTSAFALAAAKHALADAGLSDRENRPGEIGCAYGTTFGCLEAMGVFWQKVKTTNPKFAAPLAFTHGYANSPSSMLCIEYGLRGPAATFSGERLAGLEALMFAFDQIASGAGDIILTGASESLTKAMHSHLFASNELSRSGNWNDGIIPGEGAAMLVLESEDSAKRRNAKVLAEIDGINFFPLDPKTTVAPLRIATDRQETLVCVSTPNIHPRGGWTAPLLALDMAAFAPKLFSGEVFSVSPLLGVLSASNVLGGKVPVGNVPLLDSKFAVNSVRYATATGYDPGGSLGMVMLKK